MKVRSGFVSNSSSTSFAIYGIYVQDEEALMNKLLGEPKETKTEGCKHRFDREKFKFCSECGAKAWDIEVEERNSYDELEDYFSEHPELELDVVQWGGGSNCGEGTYLGKDLESKELNESKNKLEVLAKTEASLKKLIPNANVRFFSDGGYDA